MLSVTCGGDEPAPFDGLLTGWLPAGIIDKLQSMEEKGAQSMLLLFLINSMIRNKTDVGKYVGEWISHHPFKYSASEGSGRFYGFKRLRWNLRLE